MREEFEFTVRELDLIHQIVGGEQDELNKLYEHNRFVDREKFNNFIKELEDIKTKAIRQELIQESIVGNAIPKISGETINQIYLNLGNTMKNLNKIWNDDNHELIEDVLLDVAVSIKLLSDKCEWLPNLSVEAKNVYSKAEEELEHQGYYN